MSRDWRRILGAGLAAALLTVTLATCEDDTVVGLNGRFLNPFNGQQIFRFETFANEPFWTDTLRLNELIQSSVSPRVALSLGLKVDADTLPSGFLSSADLDDPATTVELIRRGAVVGIVGEVDESGTLVRVGITCALCHSTVDDAVQPGIGRRVDGPANRDLNVGAILALAPGTPDNLRPAFETWGPGKFDARVFGAGTSDGTNPTLIPPAYGLRGVNLHTWTGEGSIPYWNNYVAVTQMHGRGSFRDPRLGLDIIVPPDLDEVTPRLPALQVYQLALPVPRPTPGSFDPAAAERGKAVFEGQARCATCHIPPLYTDAAGYGLHRPEETGMDPRVAQISTTGMYRTAPLRGVAAHPPYFHDGSAATLEDVVDPYDRVLGLNLSPQQKSDLVEYLKSL